MEYLKSNNLPSSLQRLASHGGQAQRASEKAVKIIGNINIGMKNPFHGVTVTRHGESRINHCVKYELGNGYRLVTVKNEHLCVLCFAGDHNSTDKWLEKNRGLTITKDEGRWETIYKSRDIKLPDTRVGGGTDLSPEKLVMRIDQAKRDLVLDGVPFSLSHEIFNLDSTATEEVICELAIKVPDNDRADLVFDVLMLLRAGNLEEADARIRNFTGEVQEVYELEEEELVEIQDGETIKRIVVGSPEYVEWFRKFISSANYQDWMLFLHPEQQKIVDADFDGSAKLSGVSGSGKTCVLVKRAIRLAGEMPKEQVLVLTLNKSLANLINNLMDYACLEEDVRKRIVVKSFFELCQECLIRFEPENAHLYNDVTWKLEEHIDEVWREYYRCEVQNDDAEVLWPIHIALNNLAINPEDYLRQEFDWLRSALEKENRKQYFEIERKGRAIPFAKDRRVAIVDGLNYWEEKMRDIGVIDYLGLATNLIKHISKIKPAYGAVLVDEAQDFGTIELKIVRKLVKEGSNDIFLTGDMAQHILPKHQSFKGAGISIPGARSFTIRKNYRNSREILKAAYHVLYSTMDMEIHLYGELEIQDPKYSNFSSPKPLVLEAEDLEQEVAFAMSLMKERAGEGERHKGCIALAGHTMLEVEKFGRRLNIPVLDGTRGLMNSNLFLSDLEQSKGYEFDTMCILNCDSVVLPPLEMPREEQFRAACRFYVAMTRAKRELVLSYSGVVSPWLTESSGYFDFDDWENHFDPMELKTFGIPKKLPQIIDHKDADASVLDLNGRRFLYTKYAIGLPTELQGKIEELIDGKGLIRDGKRIKWPHVRAAMYDVESYPSAKNLFGPETHKKFLEAVRKLQ